MTSAVLSLFNSSSIELSAENDKVRLLDCTIGSNSSCQMYNWFKINHSNLGFESMLGIYYI